MIIPSYKYFYRFNLIKTVVRKFKNVWKKTKPTKKIFTKKGACVVPIYFDQICVVSKFRRS